MLSLIETTYILVRLIAKVGAFRIIWGIFVHRIILVSIPLKYSWGQTQQKLGVYIILPFLKHSFPLGIVENLFLLTKVLIPRKSGLIYIGCIVKVPVPKSGTN